MSRGRRSQGDSGSDDESGVPDFREGEKETNMEKDENLGNIEPAKIVAVVDEGMDVHPTIAVMHRCLMFGKPLPKQYHAWQGIVKINKDARATISDENGKPFVLKIPGNKAVRIGLAILQDLIRQAVQEGPEEKRLRWNVTGKNMAENPLDLEIIREEVSVNSPAAFKQEGIPTLG